MLNTAMLYELAVIKTQAEPLLQQVPENCEEYAEAYRLLKFLKYFKVYLIIICRLLRFCESSWVEARSIIKGFIFRR